MLLVRMLLLGLFCFLKLMFCRDVSSQITPTDGLPLSGTANGNLTEKQLELEKRRNDLEVAINETEVKLNEAKEEKAKLEEKERDLNTNITALNTELEKLDNETANVDADKEAHLKDVNATETEIRNVTKILSGIEAKLLKAINNTKQETARYNEVNKTMAELDKQIKKAEEMMDEYLSDMRTLNKGKPKDDPAKPPEYWDADNLLQKYNQADANFTELSEKKSTKMKELEAIEARMDNFTIVQEGLKKKRRQPSEKLDELNSSLSRKKGDYLVKQFALEIAQGKEDENLNNKTRMEAELATLTNETIPVAKKKIEDIKEELRQQKEELSGVKADIVKEKERTPEREMYKSLEDSVAWMPLVLGLLTLFFVLVSMAVPLWIDWQLELLIEQSAENR